MSLAKKVVIKNRVTVSPYSWKGREEGIFKVLGDIRIGSTHEIVDKKDGEIKKEKKADLMRIVDLETGNEADMIMPSVLASIMRENGEYIGKSFLAVKGTKPGKRYNTFEVSEIEEPVSDAPVEKSRKR